jgi:lysophospholipase L1-like esterase
MRKRLMGLLLLANSVAGQAQSPGGALAFQDEIRAFEAADAQSPPTQCAILFVGSSSIRMWNTLARDLWPHPVINRGFGGSTISDVNLHFDRVVAPYEPRAIFFYAGENDLAAGEAPQQVVAKFRAFLRRKQQALGSTPVYFLSLKPSRARFGQLTQQQQVNAAVKRLAAARADLEYVDVASPMMERGRPRNIFQGDELHMSAAGYRIWTRILRPKVAQAAQRRCTAKSR